MKRTWAETLRRILSQPTAAFREESVVAAVEGWASRRELDVESDAEGNLVIRLRRGRRPRNRWVFAAHMDHPAFVVRRSRGRTVWAEFRGGVKKEYFEDGAVVFPGPEGPVRGRIAHLGREGRYGFDVVRVDLAGEGAVAPGTIGSWDVPVFRLRGDTVCARSCDDLAGVAAILCAMDELRRGRGALDVTALLTRAEEVGFMGALAASRSGILDGDARIVAIEASKAQKAAPLGGGVVIRVGDKSSSFDRALTNLVGSVATDLGKRDRAFRHTRQLMPGGTCESTVYCAHGFQATGLCLPLGNYHNQGPRGRAAAEQISAVDFASLVKLLVALGVSRATPEDEERKLRLRVEKRFARRRRLFVEGPGSGGRTAKS